MKNVLIHALGATMGGAVRHLTNFLPELGVADQSRNFTVLVRQSFPELKLPENIILERIDDARATSWSSRLFFDSVMTPWRLYRGRFAGIVSLTNFGPIWSPVPHILFQRNPVYYCAEYLRGLNWGQRAETSCRRFIAVHSMRNARLVITPSNAMAGMIFKTCPQLRRDHFRTIYHGFSLDSLSGDTQQSAEVDGGGRPKLFFPSHLGEYKGYRMLFAAVAILKRDYPSLQLLLTIGGHGDDSRLMADYYGEFRRLGIVDNVRLLGHVRQDQIGAIYRSADVMVYPSYCESFGFSMVEAMGCCLPIAAADTAVNREICGEAAEYFAPFDADDCAQAVRRILEDVELRRRLCGLGAQRVAATDWSWARYAREFVAALDEAGA